MRPYLTKIAGRATEEMLIGAINCGLKCKVFEKSQHSFPPASYFFFFFLSVAQPFSSTAECYPPIRYYRLGPLLEQVRNTLTNLSQSFRHLAQLALTCICNALRKSWAVLNIRPLIISSQNACQTDIDRGCACRGADTCMVSHPVSSRKGLSPASACDAMRSTDIALQLAIAFFP